MRIPVDRTHVRRHMCTFVLAALAMTFPGGCGKHLAGRPKRIQLIENKTPTEFEKTLIDLEDQYDKPGADAQARRNIRDKYARKMIAVVDKRYNDFLDDLISQRKGFDASTDITAISLDTASVLFTPTTTKSILAGLAALTTAGKTVVSKVYFYEQTLPALVSQMEADRQAVLADIVEGLSAGVDIYPLHQTLRDLNRYYTAGTIDGAVTGIQKQSAKRAEEAQLRIRKEVESDLREGRARRDRAFGYMTDEANFKKVVSKVKEQWPRLPDDERWEKIGVIVECARGHGVSVETLGDNANPDRLGSLLDTLQYSKQADRSFIADVVRIVENIDLAQ